MLSLLSLQWELLPNRWLRLATAGILTLFAIKLFTIRNPLGIVIFLLLVLSDFFLLFWEQPFSKAGYYISHITAMAILVFLTIRELKWPKVSAIEGLFLLFFFAANSAILLVLGNHFGGAVDDVGLRILFYTNGILILLLVMSAFFYSIRFANDVSAFLFLAVMGVTVSDLLLFGIYFADLGELRYVDNIFYIIGLYFLLSSYNEYRQEKEEKATVKEREAEKEKTPQTQGLKVYR